MASAEARTTALLFSFSALLLLLLARAVLLQPPTAQTRRRGADLVLAALDRVVDGRGILRLATRTNMVLLCHAILLLILRDAGVLGSPARRRRTSPPAATRVATVVAASATPDPDDAENDAFTVAPSSRSVVVWRRRPRDGARDADAGETGRRHVKRQTRRSPRTAARAEIPAAAPALTQEQEQVEWHTQVSSREIVIVDKAPTTNHLPGDKDRAAAANARKSKSDLEDRRVVVTGHRRKASVAAEETAAGVELADDRRIEEFIANQWSMMRQESLQLVRTASQQAITTC